MRQGDKPDLKSDLEDDISAITMLPDIYKDCEQRDDRLDASADKKAMKSISRKTGMIVGNSFPRLRFSVQMGEGLVGNFDLKGMPEIDDERIIKLAYMQVQAACFCLSFDQQANVGRYLPERLFHAIIYAMKSDWANDIMKDFMKKIEMWDDRFYMVTANGFFKMNIRRSLHDQRLHSWALEWNQSMRVIGVYGADEPAKEFLDATPKLELNLVTTVDGRQIYCRTERRLASDQDILFRTPPELSEA